jgi:hypothetical protein
MGMEPLQLVVNPIAQAFAVSSRLLARILQLELECVHQTGLLAQAKRNSLLHLHQPVLDLILIAESHVMEPVDVSVTTGRLQLVIFIQRLQLVPMVQRVPLVTIIPSNYKCGNGSSLDWL